jgi:hypothetical protein
MRPLLQHLEATATCNLSGAMVLPLQVAGPELRPQPAAGRSSAQQRAAAAAAAAPPAATAVSEEQQPLLPALAGPAAQPLPAHLCRQHLVCPPHQHPQHQPVGQPRPPGAKPVCHISADPRAAGQRRHLLPGLLLRKLRPRCCTWCGLVAPGTPAYDDYFCLHACAASCLIDCNQAPSFCAGTSRRASLFSPRQSGVAAPGLPFRPRTASTYSTCSTASGLSSAPTLLVPRWAAGHHVEARAPSRVQACPCCWN